MSMDIEDMDIEVPLLFGNSSKAYKDGYVAGVRGNDYESPYEKDRNKINGFQKAKNNAWKAGYKRGLLYKAPTLPEGK